MLTTHYGRAVRLMFAAFAIVLAPTAAQAQISIVVAADAEVTASQDELKQMFGGAVTSWASGAQVQIVDQPESAVGGTFYSDFLGRSVSQVQRAFTALLLSGQAPKPEVVANDAAVKEAVTKMNGAVGYISSASLDGSVKELARVGG